MCVWCAHIHGMEVDKSYKGRRGAWEQKGALSGRKRTSERRG